MSIVSFEEIEELRSTLGRFPDTGTFLTSSGHANPTFPFSP